LCSQSRGMSFALQTGTRCSQGVRRTQAIQDPPQRAEHKKRVNTESQPLTARMLNEFVYCPRLFYYEHVEGTFVHNADTVRGAAVHQRVDFGSGSLPSSTKKPAAQASEETIHSRSVTLGSAMYGVSCKIDLVETAPDPDDLFNRLKACPVEYKVGTPQ